MKKRIWSKTVAAIVLGSTLAAGAAELTAPGSVASVKTDENLTLEFGQLSVPGEVRNFAAVDIDGDGLKDVLATYSQKDEKKPMVDRRFALFLNSKSAGFPPNPTRTWAAPVQAAAYDVGRFRSGSKTPQIVYFMPQGIYVSSFDGDGVPSEPVQVYSGDSWYLAVDRKNLTRQELLIDLNGDGVLEALLPRGETVDILKLGAADAQATVAGTLKLPLKTEVETWSEGVMMFKRIETASAILTYRLPEFRVGEFNGDGRPDLYAVRDDKAMVFVQKEGGSFESDPQVFDFDLFSWDDMDRRSKPATIFRIEALDINADGLLDISVARTDQTSLKNLDLKHQTRIYYNKGGRFTVSKPDYSVVLSTWIEMPYFTDVNGDRRLDLAFLYVKFNLWTIIKAITAGSVSPQLDVYVQNADGSFPAKRTDNVSLSKGYQLDRLDSSLGLKPLFADFNGDGWSDAFYNAGVERYSVVLSDKAEGSLFTDGDEASFDGLRGSYHMTLTDFEGDGRPDIAARHENSPAIWNQILVIRNRGFAAPK